MVAYPDHESVRWGKPVGQPSSEGGPHPARRQSTGASNFAETHDDSIGLKIPVGWSVQVTPDGFPYFVNEGDRLVTPVHIRKHRQFLRLKHWSDRLLQLIKAHQSVEPPEFAWPKKWEAYLNIRRRGKDNQCAYYLVDHDNHKLFWMQEDLYELKFGHKQIGNKDSSMRIRNAMRAWYWSHMWYFPHVSSPEGLARLRHMLVYAAYDVHVAPGSLSPFSSATCEKYLSLISSLGEEDDDEMEREHSRGERHGRKKKRISVEKNSLVAHVLERFYSERFNTRWGEEAARIDRTQPSAEATNETHPGRLAQILLTLMTVFVFGTNLEFLREIEAFTVERRVTGFRFQASLARLNSLTGSSNIIAAVLFAATVSFLTVPNLNDYQCNGCLLSVAFSLASVLFGLHHVRQHSYPYGIDDGLVGSIYFHNVLRNWEGPATLAFLYSLPFALLIWSIVSFTITLYLYALQGPLEGSVQVFSLSSSSRVLQATVGSSLILVLAFTVNFFWNIWEDRSSSQEDAEDEEDDGAEVGGEDGLHQS